MWHGSRGLDVDQWHFEQSQRVPADCVNLVA